jgi:MerR family transcriptional regulator, light-induced transcriptional regulator
LKEGPLYTISQLETLSGIKAHTIRIWEKRYHLFEPHRTETNLRRYCHAELQKILNIAMLLEKGYKISRLSEMCKESLENEVQQQVNLGQNNHEVFQAQINHFVVAMTELDEALFEKTFANCILRFGLENTFVKVMYPFLYKVGFLWCTNETMPAQEHFCSNLIRQKLYAAIDGLSLTNSGSVRDSFLLFLPEDEYHDIGLLLAHYYIRRHGYRVVNVGANVPIDNVRKDITGASHVFTYFLTAKTQAQLSEYLQALSEAGSGKSVWISGNDRLLNHVSMPEGIHYLRSIPELLAVLESNHSIMT